VYAWSRTPGYFNEPELTLQSFDRDNWFYTGDVAMLLPSGAIKIIDRAKSMFKLAQGEYVAPEKIEQVCQMASLVAQVFCFGYSTKPCLVGVVVPCEEMSQKWAAQNGNSNAPLSRLCKNEEFKKAVAKEMEAVSVEEGLKGFEKIKDFKLSPEAFSVENNLLTPTFKLRREEARKQFSDVIDELYEGLEK